MTLEKLCQEIRIDFANKEKQEIRSRNRLALFCFGSIIVLAAFAFVINLAFDMQGMAYVPLVPICFVLFLWYSWKAAPSIRKIKGWQEISSLFDEVPSDPNLHFQRILYAVP